MEFPVWMACLLVHRGLIAPDSQAGGGMQPGLDIGIVAAIPQDTEGPSWRCHRHHYIQVEQKLYSDSGK